MMTRRKMVRDSLLTITGGFVTGSVMRFSGVFGYDETNPSPAFVKWCMLRHRLGLGEAYVWHLGRIDANPRSKPAFITSSESERRSRDSARKRGVPLLTMTPDGVTIQIMPDGTENILDPYGRFLRCIPAKGSKP